MPIPRVLGESPQRLALSQASLAHPRSVDLVLKQISMEDTQHLRPLCLQPLLDHDMLQTVLVQPDHHPS